MRIGIDLGGTKTEGIIIDRHGEILLRERWPTPTSEGYEAVVGNVVDLVKHLENQAGETCRVGIGTPGAISSRTGLMKNSNTVCLNGQPLHEDFQQRLDREIRIANDANCFALSEAIDGAGQDKPVVFGVIMGTGVGGGIVVNGEVVSGLDNIAGEWGHNMLEPDGPACYCGRNGCVETLISGPGLLKDYQAHGGVAVNAFDVVNHAQAGNKIATKTMQRFYQHFGRAIATVINILDPHAVVLGGGLSNIEGLYEQGVAETMRHVFNDDFHTPIVCNRYGDSSGVRGAAFLWPVD